MQRINSLENEKFIDRLDILSLLFLRPNDFIKDRIKDKTMKEMLETAFPISHWDELSNEEYIEKLLEKIDKDYIYLFVGASNPLASPYASSYYRRESRLMDVPARNIIKIMKKWGLELDESFKDLPDHISSILNLLSTLIRHYEEVDEEVLKEEIQKDINIVLKDLNWTERFRDNIKENEEVVFYSKIAQALIITLEEINTQWEQNQQ